MPPVRPAAHDLAGYPYDPAWGIPTGSLYRVRRAVTLYQLGEIDPIAKCLGSRVNVGAGGKKRSTSQSGRPLRVGQI